jgi:uncharacterized membrane protein YvbJ
MNSAVSCEKCAAEIAEDSQFCRKCGHGFGIVSDDQVPKHPVRISAVSRRACR